MTRLNDALAILSPSSATLGGRIATTTANVDSSVSPDAFAGLLSQNLTQILSDARLAATPQGDAGQSDTEEGTEPPLFLGISLDLREPEIGTTDTTAQQSLAELIFEAKEQIELGMPLRSLDGGGEEPLETAVPLTLDQIIREVVVARTAQNNDPNTTPIISTVPGAEDTVTDLSDGFLSTLPVSPSVDSSQPTAPIESIAAVAQLSPAQATDTLSAVQLNSSPRPGTGKAADAQPSAFAELQKVQPVTSQPQQATSALGQTESVQKAPAGTGDQAAATFSSPSPSSNVVTPSPQPSAINLANSSEQAKRSALGKEASVQGAEADVRQRSAELSTKANIGLSQPFVSEKADVAATEGKRTAAKKALDATNLTITSTQSPRSVEPQGISGPSAGTPVSLDGPIPVTSPLAAIQGGTDRAATSQVVSANSEQVGGSDIAQSTPLEIETPEWEMSLVDRISANLRENGAKIELALTPETLGRLEVQMELTDGRAEVTFVTETREAAKLLSQAEGRLSDLLSRQGFSLGGQDTASREETRQRPEALPGTLVHEDTEKQDTPARPLLGQGKLNLIA